MYLALIDSSLPSAPRACLPPETPVLALPGGEAIKTVATLEKVWLWLAGRGATRSDTLVCIGGGTITDLGGMAAATYMRGMDWIAVPTTLLGAVDAAIGGKTAIDAGGIKNLAGAFHPPVEVRWIPSLLTGLPRREILSGYGEILKTALIETAMYATDFAAEVLAVAPDDLEALIPFVERCMTVKRAIVEQDPTDCGVRRVLNLGHTVGHAIEALMLEKGTPISHGHAVLFGLLTETLLALDPAITGAPVPRLKALPEQLTHILRQHYPLPPLHCATDYPRLLTLMHTDKKNTGRVAVTFVRPDTLHAATATDAQLLAALDIARELAG